MSWTIRPSHWVPIVLVVAVSLAACQTTRFRTTERFPVSRGPENVIGAVVWLHGKSFGSEEDVDGWDPYYLRSLRTAGWDVFRLDRYKVVNNVDTSARAALDKVRELRQQGYSKVVLAGQSQGGWSILRAANWSTEMDAVIATAPARHGTPTSNPIGFRKAAPEFRELIQGVQPTKVMIFFFAEDEFDPGGRAKVAKSILAANGVVHEIIDRPTNNKGHNAASTKTFGREFAPRIMHFIEHGPLEIVERRIRLRWDGYLPAFSGVAVRDGLRDHLLQVELSGTEKPCSLILNVENDVEEDKWSLSCPDGRIAFGSFLPPGGTGDLQGSGTDVKGNPVVLTLGPVRSSGAKLY